MYEGNKVPQTSAPIAYAGNQAQREVPAQPGIASRVQDLLKTASLTRELAYNLRCALGIQQPEAEAKAPSPSSLVDVILDLDIRLRRANDDFRDVLTHLNS